MERDLAGIRLTISDFHRLAALCRDDPRFPATYAAWRALLDDGMRQLLAEGKTAEPLALDVAAYARWCQRVALHPGLDALRAYVIIHRSSTAAGTGDSDGAGGAAPRRKRREPGPKSAPAWRHREAAAPQRVSATGPRPA